MKMNRVQFQPGLSMAEFMDRYGSDDKCEAALIASRWPKGFSCPACGCGDGSSFRRAALLYFQRTACRPWRTATGRRSWPCRPCDPEIGRP